MRKAVIVLATAAVFATAPATAKVPGTPIYYCPGSSGATKPPFYGVTATQNVMMPIKAPRPIRVSGQYALNMRSDRLQLVEARPQGINPSILLFRLVRVADPVAGGRCRPFNGQFPPRKIYRVQIEDWRGHSITVPVRRLR